MKLACVLIVGLSGVLVSGGRIVQMDIENLVPDKPVQSSENSFAYTIEYPGKTSKKYHLYNNAVSF